MLLTYKMYLKHFISKDKHKFSQLENTLARLFYLSYVIKYKSFYD